MANSLLSIVTPFLRAKNVNLTSFATSRIGALDRAYSAKKATLDQVMSSLKDELYKHLDRSDFDKIEKEIKRR